MRFLDGMKTLEKTNVNTFFELGPQPVLCGMGANCLTEDTNASFLPSLRKGKDDFEMTLKGLGELHVRGADVNWEAFFEPYGGKKVALPTYAFQRKRYWLDTLNIHQKTLGMSKDEHPLLGDRSNVPGTDITLFSTSFSLQNLDWLKDHVILNETIFPGSGFIEMMWAVKEVLGVEGSLENILFTLPLFLSLIHI